MAAARKQAQTTATTDIQRQGNWTNCILGRRLQNGAVSRSIMRVATDPSRRRALQSGLDAFEGFVLLAKRPEKRAVSAASKMSARAQNEEIQLNQVCSASAIHVKRKFWPGSRPLDKA
jgi:hypothetical protein